MDTLELSKTLIRMKKWEDQNGKREAADDAGQVTRDVPGMTS